MVDNMMDVREIREILAPFTAAGITKNSHDDYLLVTFPRGMMKEATQSDRRRVAERLESILNKNIPTNIYVHFERCTHRCTGCHYGVVTTGNIEEIVRELLAHTKLLPATKQMRETNLFFGGGTPSLMSADQVARLYETITARFGITRTPEATLEIHPEIIRLKSDPRAYLQELRSIGITRINLGMQEANNDILQKWGRQHTFEETERIYGLLKDEGFTVNLDIIWGLPNQTLETLTATLRAAFSMEPDVVTTYYYWLRPGTVDFARYQRDKLSLPNNPVEMRHAIRTLAREYGYTQRNTDWFERTSESTQYLDRKWGSTDNALIAIGPAAYSWIFDGQGENVVWWSPIPSHNRDTSTRTRYHHLIAQGEYPLDRILYFDKDATARRHLMFNLKAGTLTRERARTLGIASSDPEEIRKLVQGCIHARLLEWRGDVLSFTDAGDVLADQIAATFISYEWLNRMEQTYDREPRYSWFPDPRKTRIFKNLILDRG